MSKNKLIELLSVTALFALTIVAYHNSIGVPFYLDDYGSIVYNPHFKDATIASLFNEYPFRVIGYLSFYVDFQNYKLNVAGYHYTNLAIHLINGCFVFFLSKKLFSTAYKTSAAHVVTFFAIATTCLFLLHPLQTQAVTYVVQRLASLVALFYLGSICCFVYARVATQATSRVFFFLFAVVFAFASFLTKQNAFTLPIVILVIEYLFFSRPLAKKISSIAGITGFVGIVLYLLFPTFLGDYIDTLDSLTRETRDITRSEYFVAQLTVLWMYIGKFLWPASLHLDYGLGYEQLVSRWTILAGVGHGAMLICAFLLRRKLPVFCFGIVFFYISHSIESGLVPITDLVFEHRTYLPNVGLAFIVSSVLILLWQKSFGFERATTPACLLLTTAVVMSYLTFHRNSEWLDPQKFYENELAFNAENVRVLHNYAELSGRAGNFEKAEALIKRMYAAAGTKIDGRMVNTHIVLLMSKGQWNDALNLAEKLLKQPGLHPRTRVHVLSNIGIIYTTLGEYERSDSYFAQAYLLGGMTTKALFAYAFSSFKNDMSSKALEVINEIKRLHPNNKKAIELEHLVNGDLTPRG